MVSALDNASGKWANLSPSKTIKEVQLVVKYVIEYGGRAKVKYCRGIIPTKVRPRNYSLYKV
jgi:hypothetical protein